MFDEMPRIEGEEKEEEDQVNLPTWHFFPNSADGWAGQLVTSAKHLASTISVFCHCQKFDAVQNATIRKVVVFC